MLVFGVLLYPSAAEQHLSAHRGKGSDTADTAAG